MCRVKRSKWFWLCVLLLSLNWTIQRNYTNGFSSPENIGRWLGTFIATFAITSLYLEFLRRCWNGLAELSNASSRQKLLAWIKLRWRWCLGGIVAAVLLFVGFSYFLPNLCPQCLLFHKAREQLYVEGVSSAGKTISYDEATYKTANTADMAKTVSLAQQQVVRFFGSREANPRIFVCLTEACYLRWANDNWSAAKSVDDKYVFVSPRGMNTAILAHELTHIEIYHRLGWQTRKIPAWFREGLAVWVSEDERYLRTPGAKDRCLFHGTEARAVVTTQAWDASPHHTSLYGQSACEVGKWIDQHGGPKAILVLIDNLRAGRSFAEALGGR
jgi:hypothetical protein